MESGHIKACNEHLNHIKDDQDGPPFTQHKNLVISPLLPISSPTRITSSPFEETALQKSQPEPTETTSPRIQAVGQPPGYDPNRIPSSIFSTKPGNPTDWSAASNESLFSIHVGNNSFSRDCSIGRSGELAKLDDWNGSQSGRFMMLGGHQLSRLEEWSLPPVMEVSSHEESGVFSGEFARKDGDLSPKFVSGQARENHGNESLGYTKKPPLPETDNSSVSNQVPSPSPSPTSLSNASGHSSSSFAFPVWESHGSGKSEPLMVVPETPEKPEKDEPPEAQNQAQVSKEMPLGVSLTTTWLSCPSCWPRLC